MSPARVSVGPTKNGGKLKKVAQARTPMPRLSGEVNANIRPFCGEITRTRRNVRWVMAVGQCFAGLPPTSRLLRGARAAKALVIARVDGIARV